MPSFHQAFTMRYTVLFLSLLFVSVCATFGRRTAKKGANSEELRNKLQHLIRAILDGEEKNEGDILTTVPKTPTTTTIAPSLAYTTPETTTQPDKEISGGDKVGPSTPKYGMSSNGFSNDDLLHGVVVQWNMSAINPSTVYEGLGDPAEPFVRLNMSMEAMLQPLQVDLVSEFGLKADMIGKKVLDLTKDMKAKILKTHEDGNLYNLRQLAKFIDEDILHMLSPLGTFPDLAALTDELVELALKGMLGGTIEERADLRNETGCYVNNRIDVVCIINKVYSLMDAAERVIWIHIEHMFTDDCFVFDCFTIYDYLNSVDWHNLDVTMAIDAVLSNAECMMSNMRLIVDRHNPKSATVSCPPFLLSKLIHYYAYINLITTEANWARDALGALIMAAEQREYGGKAAKRKLKATRSNYKSTSRVNTKALMALRDSRMYKDLKFD